MQTEDIVIGGMTCGGCVASVTRALQRVDGVQRVEVTLSPPVAHVGFDPQRASGDALRRAIADAGYDVGA